MELWRISNFATLSGEGGLYASGRWHSKGRPIVYLAEHPASALLEVMVHLEVDADDLPTHYQLLAIHVPDDLTFEVVTPASLPNDWQLQMSLTQSLGDAWLLSARTPLLRVPTALVPEAGNYLLNPVHPQSTRISVTSAALAAYDPRLATLLKR